MRADMDEKNAGSNREVGKLPARSASGRGHGGQREIRSRRSGSAGEQLE